MLVNTKARVGVFSIALGAYLPQFPSLVPEFESQYAAFKKTLPDTVEVIDGGMVTTKEQAMEAGDKFRAADVDLVFLQMLTYATSYNMLPAIRDLDVPVVLVNVQKLKGAEQTKYEIYHAIKDTLPKAKNWQEFESLLTKQGISIEYKYKGQTDEVQGISFKKGEHSFKGSDVDRKFSYGKLDVQLSGNNHVQEHQIAILLPSPQSPCSLVTLSLS